MAVFWVVSGFSLFFSFQNEEWLYFPLKVSTTSQSIYDGSSERVQRVRDMVQNEEPVWPY
jgi:hypothetical protein